MASTTNGDSSTKNGGGKEESSSDSVFDNVETLKKLCNFLRTTDGPTVREALLMDKRVLYLKGKQSQPSDVFLIRSEK
jgi:hypothetical protein